MIAYHKTFGQIKILEKNEKITTIKVLATDEIKKLATYIANGIISDKPFSEEQNNFEKLITKLETKNPIKFETLRELSIKHNLVLVNYQGDYVSLNFLGKSPKKQNITDFGVGVKCAFVTNNSCNFFGLTDGVSFEEIKKLQPLFNDLTNA